MHSQPPQTRKDLSAAELNDIDSELGKEALDKAEQTRAIERMSLRHKNQGKWAKKMLARNSEDPEVRRAVADQLQLDQDLRKKILLDESGSEDSDASDASNLQTFEGG